MLSKPLDRFKHERGVTLSRSSIIAVAVNCRFKGSSRSPPLHAKQEKGHIAQVAFVSPRRVTLQHQIISFSPVTGLFKTEAGIAYGETEMTVRKADISDIPAIARCWYHAFFDDEVIGDLMHPQRKTYPEDVYYWLLRGVRERFFDWRHQFVVFVKEDKKQDCIAGAADWRRLGKDGSGLAWWDPRKKTPLPRLRAGGRISLSATATYAV
jgi:hypothetical protein